MPYILAVITLVGGLQACFMMEKKLIESDEIKKFEKDHGPDDVGTGRCTLFGSQRAFVDCLVQSPQRGTLHSVMVVGLLKSGRDITAGITNDRRLSGESVYVLELHYRSPASPEAGRALTGLPRDMSGDLFRGDPSRGGSTLVRDVTVRIDRELFWEGRGLGKESGLFFAFQDGLRIWAVPVAIESTIRPKITALKILNRLESKELELLKKGSLIRIQATDASRLIRFGFPGAPKSDNTNRISELPYNAEIIEE